LIITGREEGDEKEGVWVKRLLTGECSPGIWFRSRIGSRGLGVWTDRICICDLVLYIFFVVQFDYDSVSQERSWWKGEERLNNWFEVEFGMRSITATR